MFASVRQASSVLRFPSDHAGPLGSWQSRPVRLEVDAEKSSESVSRKLMKLCAADRAGLDVQDQDSFPVSPAAEVAGVLEADFTHDGQCTYRRHRHLNAGLSDPISFHFP